MKSVMSKSNAGVAVTLLLLILSGTAPIHSTRGPDTIINEFMADPAPGISGDANGDGIRDHSDDEFVELVNIGSDEIDFSGWTLGDAQREFHTFPPNTVIPEGCGIVVFGGGTPTGTFGDSIVQVASSGRLSLLNSGDTIALKNVAAITITTYTYGSEGNNDQSLTRFHDLFYTEPFTLHSTAPGSGGALFSPGTRIDGSEFRSGCPGTTHYVYLPLVGHLSRQ